MPLPLYTGSSRMPSVRASSVTASIMPAVGMPSLRAKLVGHTGHRRIHVGAAGNFSHAGAEQVVEKDVARMPVVVEAIAGAVFENEMALQAETRGGRRGLPRVVRLRCALGDDGVGLQRECLGHQVFELARLVAAGREAGAIVALDVQIR